MKKQLAFALTLALGMFVMELAPSTAIAKDKTALERCLTEPNFDDMVAHADACQTAAEQGHAKAIVFLGHMYALGKGVPANYVRAYTWFEVLSLIAEDLAPPREASAAKEFSLEATQELSERMTPEQIAQAQAMAREWIKEHR